MPVLKVASLFSGCGGLDLGFVGGFEYMGNFFEKNKFKIVFANDFDKDAGRVYTENNKYLKKEHFVLSDIKSVSDADVPAFDVLVAGFPCQPFSNAGMRGGIDDKHGRGTLFYECERLIKSNAKTTGNKPSAFVFENVRGIISTKMPGKDISVPEEIQKRMERLGYNVSMKLVKASDYGVPQNRYRLLIVGIRKDLGVFDFELMDRIVKEKGIPTEDSDHDLLALGAVLADIDPNAPQQKDVWSYSPGSQYMVDKIGPCRDGRLALKKIKSGIPLDQISKSIREGKSWKNIDADQLPDRFLKIRNDPVKYRAPNFYRRFALGEISGTITASAQPENCGITHPFENRRMSIREIAKIQSFPDDFVFPYSAIAGAYKVIGNAVPPVLAWVLANALQKALGSAR